jgi:hypothetical protein
LDPPEESVFDTNNYHATEDPPELNDQHDERNMPNLKMGSRRQSEPDRLGELNDELKTLRYSSENDELGELAFEQLTVEGEFRNADALDTKNTSVDAIGVMPERFLDKSKMEELLGDAFEVDDSEEKTAEVSGEWIGNIYASE